MIRKKQLAAHLTSAHPTTDTRIVHKECATLVNAGYEVVLIAAGDAKALPDGVRFRGVPLPHGRLERMTKTVWNVYRAALDERADIYHFHDPELIFAGLALRMTGARVVFDVHEDIPRDIMDKPWIPSILKRPVSKLATLMLKVLERGYSAIVAATPAIARGFAHTRTVVVANFPQIEELVFAGKVPFERRAASVLYLGSITELRSIVELVKAYESAEMPPGVRLTLAGTFETEELERKVRAMPGWARVDYLGTIARREIPAVFESVRAGILMFRPAVSVEEAMPTKLFEYMAAHLPVLISRSLQWSELVREQDCGRVVDSMEPDAIARGIRFLVENPDTAQAMGERGHRLVTERFQWTTEGCKLTNLYRQIA
jgi:glycosyltransferase involved in cell wall biosynthesis